MPSVTYQVGASNDDAFMDYLYENQCYRTDSVVKIGYWNPAREYAGFRFTNVLLQGDKHEIVTAYLSVKLVSETTSESIQVHLYCDDRDSAPDFTTECTTMDERPTTTAYGDWTASISGSAGEWINSADMASAIQELIDRGGWAAGNPLVVLAFQQVSSGGLINVHSYDSNSSYAAKLVITYRYKGFAGAMV